MTTESSDSTAVVENGPVGPYVVHVGLAPWIWIVDLPDGGQIIFKTEFDAKRRAFELNDAFARGCAERDTLRALLKRCLPVLREYARDNPRHTYMGVQQDPDGVHKLLKELTE